MQAALNSWVDRYLWLALGAAFFSGAVFGGGFVAGSSMLPEVAFFLCLCAFGFSVVGFWRLRHPTRGGELRLILIVALAVVGIASGVGAAVAIGRDAIVGL